MWLGLLLIIHCIIVAAIPYENILDYECETDSNCINSICFNKKCITEENQLRYRRQSNYGKNN
jgi:hypothetical protein